MKKHILSTLCAAFLLLPLLASLPVHGADSTSFDPTRVEVKAKGSGGVPVGTIVAWPVATNPEDMDNWLECNGQSISPSVYPELFAVLGGQVPDLRGLFLRGFGGKSAALGTTQDQATASSGIQIATAFIDLGGGGWDGWAYAPYPQAGGSWTTLPGTGDETRPVNTAVRYLVRARP